MRALYLLRYFPALTETFVYDEIVGMHQQGFDVAVASLGERADSALASPLDGVPVHRVPRRSLAGMVRTPTPAAQQVAAWQRRKDAARLPALAAIAADFDLVAVHFAGEAAELAWALHRDLGLPYVVTVHAVDLFKPRPSLPMVLAEAAAVFTVAEHHQRVLADMGISARLVRCGPRLSDFAVLPPPSPGPMRALFVGRDVPKKGLDDLLAVWPRAAGPDAVLTAITDRPGQGWPANCHSTGLLPRLQVREHLARANVVIQPCRRAEDGDQDGVPLVLMEALAAGRPVITTAVSGIPELVDESVGWLVPSDDCSALIGAIRAAADSSERARRGRGGPARLSVRGFTLTAQVTAVSAGWRSCCKSVACGPPNLGS